MFTLADIRNIAIQIERNGEETYRIAGRASKDPDVARVLEWMADEELHHAQWFESIRSTRPLTQEQREMEAVGRALLQEMIKGNTFLLDRKELEDAEIVMEVIVRSKTFERDTIVFYEFLLSFLDDDESIGQLKKIIEEERSHIIKLEHLEESRSRESSSAGSV
jgi:rubrerythrin